MARIGETSKRLNDTRALTSSPPNPPCPGEPFGPEYAYCPIEDKPYRRHTSGRSTGPGNESFENAKHVAQGKKGTCTY